MYNDYSNYPTPFETSRATSHVQTNGQQWSTASRMNSSPICKTQPAEVSRDFSNELTSRLAMRKNKETLVGPSIQMIKRKFEGENVKLQLTTSSGSSNKSSQLINSTLEETYWAQWKPTPTIPISPSKWSNKQNLSIRGRSQFTACTTVNRCNVDPLPSSDARIKSLDEKSLKILRKPMEIMDSNSSEGDKNILGKLYIYSTEEQINASEIPPGGVRNLQQPPPNFTMSTPNYQSVYYYGPEEYKCQNRLVKLCRRKLQKPDCYERKNDRPNSPIKKVSDQEQSNCEKITSPIRGKMKSQQDNKRPKSVEQNQDRSKGKNKLTKSDEEIPGGTDGTTTESPKNRVRFFTKKHSDDSNDDDTDTYGSMKDSNRTVDGYHGDIDTESCQIGSARNFCDYDDSYEEGQGDLETDSCDHIRRRYDDVGYNQERRTQDDVDTDSYDYQYPYYQSNYYSNYRCYQSEEDSYESKSDNSYEPYHHRNVSIYRSEEDISYPANEYRTRNPIESSSDNHYRNKESSSSVYCNKTPHKEPSFSSTSKSERTGILKVREPLKMIIKTNNEPSRNVCTGRCENVLEKSCGTPAPLPKTASGCNTDPKICVNKSCETLDRVTKEKKSGDNSPCGLKVIRENSEMDAKTPNPEARFTTSNKNCKCCSDAKCHNDSTTTSSGTTSMETSKSSSESSKDTMAVVLDSSKDEIHDEESFATDDIDRKSNGHRSAEPTTMISTSVSTAPVDPLAAQSPNEDASKRISDGGESILSSTYDGSNDPLKHSCNKPSTFNGGSGFTPQSAIQNQDSGNMTKTLEKDPQAHSTSVATLTQREPDENVRKLPQRDPEGYVAKMMEQDSNLCKGTCPLDKDSDASRNISNGTTIERDDRVFIGENGSVGSNLEALEKILERNSDVVRIRNSIGSVERITDPPQTGRSLRVIRPSRAYTPSRLIERDFTGRPAIFRITGSVPSSKATIVRVRYDTPGEPASIVGSKHSAPEDQKVSLPLTREASVDNSLRHGRSFDGIRHYRKEDELVYRVTEGLKNGKGYPALGGPFVAMSNESRNSSAPTMLPKSLMFQRSPRCQVPNRPGLKGHTYTLKTPTSAGGRSPKRKR